MDQHCGCVPGDGVWINTVAVSLGAVCGSTLWLCPWGRCVRVSSVDHVELVDTRQGVQDAASGSADASPDSAAAAAGPWPGQC